MIALPTLPVPPPNACVLRRLAAVPLRDPRSAGGRALYLQRLGVVVVAHARNTEGWACTVAGASLDERAPTGAFLVSDVEVAAALEVLDIGHPLADFTAAEVRSAWLVRVWDRWPGGLHVQVAQALAEVQFIEPGSPTAIATSDQQLIIRSGLRRAVVARACDELAAAGLLASRPRTPSDDAEASRSYQLLLPGPTFPNRPAAPTEVAA